MDTEAKRIKQENKKLPFKERVLNFWLYNKWIVLGTIFVAIVVGSLIFQLATQVEPDLTVSIYTVSNFGDERAEQLTQILKDKCIDTDGDSHINVSANVYEADITGDVQDQMTQSVLVRIAAETATHLSAGYILDEAYKSFFAESYDYPEEYMIEISSIPEIKDKLMLAEGEKLYWLLDIRAEKPNKPSQFDNGEKVDKYFKESVK